MEGTLHTDCTMPCIARRSLHGRVPPIRPPGNCMYPGLRRDGGVHEQGIATARVFGERPAGLPSFVFSPEANEKRLWHQWKDSGSAQVAPQSARGTLSKTRCVTELVVPPYKLDTCMYKEKEITPSIVGPPLPKDPLPSDRDPDHTYGLPLPRTDDRVYPFIPLPLQTQKCKSVQGGTRTIQGFSNFPNKNSPRQRGSCRTPRLELINPCKECQTATLPSGSQTTRDLNGRQKIFYIKKFLSVPKKVDCCWTPRLPPSILKQPPPITSFK